MTAVDESRERLAHVRDAETVQYEADGETWRHSFAMRVFADDEELDAALAEAGLCLQQRLDPSWFVAVPVA